MQGDAYYDIVIFRVSWTRHLSLPRAHQRQFRVDFLEKGMFTLKDMWYAGDWLRMWYPGLWCWANRQVLPTSGSILTKNLRLILLIGGRSMRGKHAYSPGEWILGLGGGKEDNDMFTASYGLATSPNSQVASKRCMPLEQLGCQGQPQKAASF